MAGRPVRDEVIIAQRFDSSLGVRFGLSPRPVRDGRTLRGLTHYRVWIRSSVPDGTERSCIS